MRSAWHRLPSERPAVRADERAGHCRRKARCPCAGANASAAPRRSPEFGARRGAWARQTCARPLRRSRIPGGADRQNRMISAAGNGTNERPDGDAPLRPVRVDAVAALSAGAAARGLHLGHCRILLSGHHAGRRDPHHRDGGDERVPHRTARQDPRPQRPSPGPAARFPAHRLGGGGRPHRPGPGRAARGAGRRRPGAGVLALQRQRRAGARHSRRRPCAARLDREQHPPGHAGGVRPRPGRRHRPAARGAVVAAGRRQRDAGVAARRRHADGHDAPHQALQGRGGLRDRHVGIRCRLRVHAARRRPRPISTAPAM